jgi:hypothetical protein
MERWMRLSLIWKRSNLELQIYYIRKANQVRQAGHIIPVINPYPPLRPFRVVEERTCSPNRSLCVYERGLPGPRDDPAGNSFPSNFLSRVVHPISSTQDSTS